MFGSFWDEKNKKLVRVRPRTTSKEEGAENPSDPTAEPTVGGVLGQAHKQGTSGEIPQRYSDTELSIWDAKMITAMLSIGYQNQKSLLLFGDPGLGKSAIITSFCKTLATQIPRSDGAGPRKFIKSSDIPDDDHMAEVILNAGKYFMLHDERLAGVEPSDIKGIPNIHNVSDTESRERVVKDYLAKKKLTDTSSEFLEYHKPAWAVWAAQKDAAGYLFFDELNQGDPQVLNAMYQVVYDRTAAGLKFSKLVGIAAAGNFADEANETRALPTALSNRFMQGAVVANSREWFEWAKKPREVEDVSPGFEIAPELGPRAARENPVATQTTLHSALIAFIEAMIDDPKKGSVLYKKPESKEVTGAWPSHRSITRLSDDLYAIDNAYTKAVEAGETPDIKHYISIIYEAAAANCGVTWAHEFHAFITSFFMFSMDYIYREKNSLMTAKKHKNPDLNLTHLNALVYYISGQVRKNLAIYTSDPKGKPAALDQLCKLSEVLGNLSSELIMQFQNSFKLSEEQEYKKNEGADAHIPGHEVVFVRNGFLEFIKILKTDPNATEAAKKACFEGWMKQCNNIAQIKKLIGA